MLPRYDAQNASLCGYGVVQISGRGGLIISIIQQISVVGAHEMGFSRAAADE